MRNRAKGVSAEREAAVPWQTAGFDVRGLEAGGDHLILGGGLTIAQEVKRCERLKLPEWIRQLEGDAPQGTIAVLTYRQNREPWRSVLRTDDLIALVVAARGGAR